MGLLDRLFGTRQAPPKQVLFERPWVSLYESPIGWEWREESRTGAGFRLDEVKFRSSGDSGTLLLYLKDYHAPEKLETVERLLARDWGRHYATIIPTITACQVARAAQPLLHGLEPACEVNLVGGGRIGDPLASIRLRERHTPVGGHMLMVSAVGPQDLYEQHALVIDNFFATAVFIQPPRS